MAAPRAVQLAVVVPGLDDGAHTFVVRPTDAVGNIGTAASRTWRIDATSSQTTLRSAPRRRTTSLSARFTFSANEATEFECKLDSAAFARCTSPKRYAGLRRRAHRFQVRAIDQARNVDSTPAVRRWTIASLRTARAASALLAPAAGARVSSPPLLAWRPVARAVYYNVQLYRGAVKVLSTWPTSSAFSCGRIGRTSVGAAPRPRAPTGGSSGLGMVAVRPAVTEPSSGRAPSPLLHASADACSLKASRRRRSSAWTPGTGRRPRSGGSASRSGRDRRSRRSRTAAARRARQTLSWRSPGEHETLLLRRGYRVAMTRTGPVPRRQRRAGAVLQPPRRRADAADPRRRLDRPVAAGRLDALPARRRGWTDDVHGRSRRARGDPALARRGDGRADLGLVERSDLTGFNWADVPVVLVETGFMTNPTEGRLLRTSAYQWRVARGLAAGVAAFTSSLEPRILSTAARLPRARRGAAPRAPAPPRRRPRSSRRPRTPPGRRRPRGTRRGGAQLLRPRVGFRHRARLPPDGAPHRRNAERHSAGQEREAAVHGLDATLPPASCLARRAPPEAPSTRQGRLRPKEGEIGP